MTHLRVLICRVEDETDEMIEVASVDLPAVLAQRSGGTLNTIEAHVTSVGHRLLGQLCEIQWDEMDAQEVLLDTAGMQYTPLQLRVTVREEQGNGVSAVRRAAGA